MPSQSERDAAQEVLKRYAALQQAATDAEFWRSLAQQEIKTAHDQAIARAEADYDGTMRQLSDEYLATTAEAHRAAQQVGNDLGILASPWQSQQWASFEPILWNAPGQSTRLLAVPGGLRVGTIVQSGVERPILNASALVLLIGHGHIIIVSTGNAKDQALRLLQSLVTRIAVTFPVLSARFVRIDPLGLGDNFPFKRLPESIRGAMVYSEPDEIRAQMRELTEYQRRVTQEYLGRDFDNIEAYNQKIGKITEPYRFLCVSDFPAKFDEDAATRLLSIAQRGVRTGVYILMHINADMPMPHDFDLPTLLRTATQIYAEPNRFVVPISEELFEFIPDDPPSRDLFNSLLDKIRTRTEPKSFKGMPFERVVGLPQTWWTGDSRSLIENPIGRAGTGKFLNFWLGKQKDGQISSHALVGGKADSGKSTLLHVIINSLALKYAPDEIELYLIAFKDGIEFTPYADARLPHARVIAIESEREFALSVLGRLQGELERRDKLFRQSDAQDLTSYRERTGQKLPRIVLIIDEFQKLVEDQDTVSSRAVQIVDDLARRGRAFGLHMVLGSQSFTAANLPKNFYGQFATRILLQSPEAEVIALLGTGNVEAATTLQHPGDLVYNDDGGSPERNQWGQVAILLDKAIPKILSSINKLIQERAFKLGTRQLVFRGNQASWLDDNPYLQKLYSAPTWLTSSEIKALLGLREWLVEEKPALAWLGEAVEIKPPAAVTFRRGSRSNLAIFGDNEETVFGMIGATLISLAGFHKPDAVKFRIIDLSLSGEAWEDTCLDFQRQFSVYDVAVETRPYASKLLDEVADLIKERQQRIRSGEGELGASVYLLVSGIHKMPDLSPVAGQIGQHDYSENASKLMEIIRNGSELGVHVILWCDSYKNFDLILGSRSLDYFNFRVGLPMSKADSQAILGESVANTLRLNRAYLRDEQSNYLAKFKPYTLGNDKAAQNAEMRRYAERLQKRAGA